MSEADISFDISEISGLVGTSGNEIINGTSGDDVIVDGLGLDILTGGLGSDQFVITNNDNNGDIDTVTDFTHGEDVIDISSFSDYIDVRQLDMEQLGDDTVIYFDEERLRDNSVNRLVLKNVDKDLLTNSDFKFREFDGVGYHEMYDGLVDYDFSLDEIDLGGESVDLAAVEYTELGSSGAIDSTYSENNFYTGANIFNDGTENYAINHETAWRDDGHWVYG